MPINRNRVTSDRPVVCERLLAADDGQGRELCTGLADLVRQCRSLSSNVKVSNESSAVENRGLLASRDGMPFARLRDHTKRRQFTGGRGSRIVTCGDREEE
jgi:hypothetical protein